MSKMIKTIEFLKEFIAGMAEEGDYRYGEPGVNKTTLEGIDEIRYFRYLYVLSWTSIKMHAHDNQFIHYFFNVHCFEYCIIKCTL